MTWSYVLASRYDCHCRSKLACAVSPLQVEEEFLDVWGRFSAGGADVSSDEESSEDLPNMAAMAALDHVKAGKSRRQGPTQFYPAPSKYFDSFAHTVSRSR